MIVLGDLNAKTGSENDAETSCDCETFSIFAPNNESGLDKSTMVPVDYSYQSKKKYQEPFHLLVQ